MELLRLKKNGKAPLVAGSFNGEDKVEVKKWVAEGGNYGILTGKLSGIAVIDIDTHNGVSGADNLKEFCEKYDIELPDTKTVMTPSGGLHLYYNLPEKYNDVQFIQNHKELEGVDFQTHGRYVVGWGSTIDGLKYQVINNQPIADLPAKWFDIFTDKTIQKKNKKRERKFTANLLGDIIAGCDEGGRNNFLTQIIGKLFATGLEHEEVRVWSLYVNQISLNPPLSEEEVLRTYESVRKREIRRMDRD
ncbi:primase/polymerase protein [Enterococcus phage phiSHEF10]|uniref:Bifunctional DNA primase/polymerase n=2 Tax=Efquatrovirus SHEF2 TaxID=2560430 RepID=A0A249XUG8_9CAUD|nr:DNA polymerase/primase [Enterococcus phage phiSHEF2]ASZ75562.1 bifunctional DNA primase/polymerase [Enterococcus phage phiSHEF2]UMO76532.1 primase/polymerase protein [Enterococcus phage phiSHEF10]